MNFGVPTKVETVLQAIADKAATAGSWISATYVWQSLDVNQLLQDGFTADSVVVVSNIRGDFNQPEIAGGGTQVFTVDGTVDVTLYDRLSVDEANRDTTRLQSQTLGILAKWLALMNVLAMHKPLDPLGSGDSILSRPMRPLSFATGPANQVTGWASIVTPWEVKFRLALS